ncbi:hypothetical protein [Legionella sp. PC997]|uniref:hypothetical protein n=1 Tax=Legionella sp. PC997 TaxID=2755562 RepID=UPI001862942A|nr:hypothetical protein [Legionella sp. PC997]QMT59589.1 hypothetical protein HBNCFIEN_00955 [Legionella sp. PC997]
MKRLIPFLLLVPFLTSCEMSDPEYYDAGYYHTVPPRAEIYGFDEHPQDYRPRLPYHRGQKINATPSQNKVHGHHQQTHKQIPNPKQVVVNNSNKSTAHGHEKKNQVVKHHPSELGSKVVVTE